MISLDTYIDSAMDVPWTWGRLDCCFFAGDWIRYATDKDPLGPYRETYDSALAAERLIKARGGLLAMVSAEMARCGFEPTANPDHGDIGVAKLKNGSAYELPARASVVIKNGPWWVGASLDGVSFVAPEEVPIVRAWRVLP